MCAKGKEHKNSNKTDWANDRKERVRAHFSNQWLKDTWYIQVFPCILFKWQNKHTWKLTQRNKKNWQAVWNTTNWNSRENKHKWSNKLEEKLKTFRIWTWLNSFIQRTLTEDTLANQWLDSMLLIQGGVRFLFRELRSHIPCSMAKQKNKPTKHANMLCCIHSIPSMKESASWCFFSSRGDWPQHDIRLDFLAMKYYCLSWDPPLLPKQKTYQ